MTCKTRALGASGFAFKRSCLRHLGRCQLSALTPACSSGFCISRQRALEYAPQNEALCYVDCFELLTTSRCRKSPKKWHKFSFCERHFHVCKSTTCTCVTRVPMPSSAFLSVTDPSLPGWLQARPEVVRWAEEKDLPLPTLE